ncbi:hypothetical protein I601_0207 [Nocardioides dokdonensis FR1436]|uniref:Uncharacterized protein n=1 Tax=Nocardioides dokdonensis FR1436 TaxID=1300347 RepID=A0A1A9GGK2_9ACTN|nr:hypothetical protein [Nocardioides dokdonensis]ANH36661.1 hypothetical protein I601_0207 [Nocardioides dokdonensis FR1436]
MTGSDDLRHATPPLVAGLDVTAKAGLVMLLVVSLLFPDLGNVEDKAAGLRAIAYPVLAFTVPVVWWVFWRERASFPWVADLMITSTCFTDTLGNRLDLYDSVVWFDDLMHLMNTGLLTAAVLVLTMRHRSTFAAVLERSLAFGVTAAVGWEIAEYFAFISKSSERRHAYADTLGDLALGSLGAVIAGVVVHGLWRRGLLVSAAPQLEPYVASAGEIGRDPREIASQA